MKAKTTSTMFDLCLISPDFALIQIITNAFKISLTGKVTRLTIMTKITNVEPREEGCNSHRSYPPFLHALYDRWDKSNVTWYFRGQTKDNICQYEKSRCGKRSY